VEAYRLLAVLLAATVVFLTGIDWGLPDEYDDDLLFGGRQAWSGARLTALVGGDVLSTPQVAADVDVNPVAAERHPVELTDTPSSQAELIVRYRLYSRQPDEMITFRALYSARRDGDPRLYQYGGLFIYPVGAALRVASAVGLVVLKDDLAFYLDHPAAFGRFYVVARLVVLGYGLAGVALCYALGRRFAGDLAGVIAAILFVLMPITVNMVHEAKPHLPAAVWMLGAVLAGDAFVRRGGWRACLLVGAICGLAMSNVLSAWPVWLVLPAMLLARHERWASRVGKLAAAGALSGGVYLLFNPFVVINLFVNPAVLRSNFENSAAMYQVGSLGAGMANVVRLSLEAAGAAVLLAGLAGVVWLCRRQRARAAVIVAPAAAALAVMITVGAGKPAEFARFGVFAYAVLAVLAGCVSARLIEVRGRAGFALIFVLLAATGFSGTRYMTAFATDAYGRSTRIAAAHWLANRLVGDPDASIGVVQEPAPYAMGPMDFAGRRVVLLPDEPPGVDAALPDWLVVSADRRESLHGSWWLREYGIAAVFPDESFDLMKRPTPISWANKPVFIFRRSRAAQSGESVTAQSSRTRRERRCVQWT